MLPIIDCDVGFTLNNVTYQFPDIDDITIEDPRKQALVRGMNGVNKVGILITEGQDQPFIITANIKGVRKALFDAMKPAYNNRSRFTFYVIDRRTGNSQIYNNCIFNDEPMQKNIASSAETVTMAVVIHSFDKKEKMK